MKAITKFKSLLTPKEVGQKRNEPTPTGTDGGQEGGKPSKPQSRAATPGGLTGEEKAKAAADRATDIIHERKRFLNSSTDRQQSVGEKGHAHAVTEVDPPFLGIGRGGRDDFPSGDLPPASVLSDSPTAVHFNVYDRAFEEEVDKIKRSTSRKGRSQGRGTTIYLTKHLRDEKKYKTIEDPDITWVGDGDSTDEEGDIGTGKGAVEKFKISAPRSGPSFADLVAGAVQGAKSKVQEAVGVGQDDEQTESKGVDR